MNTTYKPYTSDCDKTTLLKGIEDLRFDNRNEAYAYLEWLISKLDNVIEKYGCFTPYEVKAIIEEFDFVHIRFEKKFTDMKPEYTDTNVFVIERMIDGYRIAFEEVDNGTRTQTITR